jgi:hypothetical protein
MFRTAQLFNLNDDVKFYQIFKNMDPIEFEFFVDRKTYDSWITNFELLSTNGINQMKSYIDEKNDSLMSRRFDEMRLLFSQYYLKKVRNEIDKVYRSWFSKIENSNFVTLRYLALKYNLGDVLERVFETQRDSYTLRSDVDDIDQVMIVSGNPFFYFCKKFTDYQSFDTSSRKLLRDYQLKSFLDTPIYGMSGYNSKFNPAYGNLMNSQYGYNLSGKQMLYVLLKVYDLEKLLDPPQQPKNESSSTNDSDEDDDDDNN